MTADLVRVSDVQAIEALDPQAREIAVTHMLAESRSWLANAMATTDPTSVADLRVWLASVEQWTRRFNLAKEIQRDAQEMLRRAEYGMARKLLDAQERGETTRGGRPQLKPTGVSGGLSAEEKTPRLTDFVSRDEWQSAGGGPGIRDVAAGVTPEAFSAAIEAAKAEGNLSRANVVRKVKGEKNTALTTVQKLARIRELSEQAWSSPQIARDLGVGEEWVRKLAKDNGIEIRADRVIGRTRRIDPNKVAAEIVATLDGLALPIRLINFTELDPERAAEWANSLTESIRALNRFAKQMKELAQ